MKIMRSIFWFKRDLRVEDNRALIKCLRESDEVYPIFIFCEDILEDLKAFDNRLCFVRSAVEELKKTIPLSVFYGKDTEIFEYLIDLLRPKRIYTASALSWSGSERILKIKTLCKEKGVEFVEVFDNFLVDVRKIDYTKIFTPFYKKWINHVDSTLEPFEENLSKKAKKIQTDKFQIPEKIRNLKVTGDFFWTLDFLNQRLTSFDFKSYKELRNRLDIDGTSKLSPYIRFGIVSVRKIFQLVKGLSETYIKELAWREFWYHIRHYFPEMKNLEFQEKRRNLNWSYNDEIIEKFIKAETGYPIIDAAIRQLKQENWMHNRARMIVGSFLTKDLLIDWRIGERFFAENLLDYDEVVNTGNWQWIASVGPDPKPLRIFNPLLQAKKFDPNCYYIKKYIPELKNSECIELLDPLKFRIKGYFPPIVNHYERVKKIREIFKNM
ncbi:MAG: cryptochrome/photolyase family protein [Caldimicrobium sp.]